MSVHRDLLVIHEHEVRAQLALTFQASRIEMVKKFLLQLHFDWSSKYSEEYYDRLASITSDLQSKEDNTSDAEPSRDSPTLPSGRFWDSDSSEEAYSPPLSGTPPGQRYWHDFNPNEHDSPSQQESLWCPATTKTPAATLDGFHNLFSSLCGELECSCSELELARAQEANSLFQSFLSVLTSAEMLSEYFRTQRLVYQEFTFALSTFFEDREHLDR